MGHWDKSQGETKQICFNFSQSQFFHGVYLVLRPSVFAYFYVLIWIGNNARASSVATFTNID